MPEPDTRSDFTSLSDHLAGLVVADLAQPTPDAIALRFTNGAVLDIRPTGDGFTAILSRPRSPRGHSGPTRRQQEYLDFIKRYMHRFGVAPAETDIQRHFLVSAPSVNQMVRTLERRGFIERGRDWYGRTVPRSIRVVWDG